MLASNQSGPQSALKCRAGSTHSGHMYTIGKPGIDSNNGSILRRAVTAGVFISGIRSTLGDCSFILSVVSVAWWVLCFDLPDRRLPILHRLEPDTGHWCVELLRPASHSRRFSFQSSTAQFSRMIRRVCVGDTGRGWCGECGQGVVRVRGVRAGFRPAPPPRRSSGTPRGMDLSCRPTGEC